MPSAAVIAALTAQETGEGFVMLLEISHAALVDSIRVCNHKDGITSNGDVYQFFPFRAPLIDQTPDSPPRIELVIDNVDRQIVEAIESISTSPDVTMSVVMASDPDTIEVGPYVMKLKDPKYNLYTVSGELSFENILSLPSVKGSFSPADFPGLFG